MIPTGLLPKFELFFSRTLDEYGPTPQGVGWNGEASQVLRFRQLLRVYDGRSPFSVIDFGCGYGGLVPFVEALGEVERYVGVDVSPAMLEHARERYGDKPHRSFLDSDDQLASADFAIACGVFHLKLDTPVAEWRDYVLATIDRLAELSGVGFAFNMLTRYSDPERMRDDLYYADPVFFFDYCKTHLGRNVALLHDYGLYDFTIIVRKELRPE